MPKTNIDDETQPGWRAEVGWSPHAVQVATVNTRTTMRLEDEPFDGWHITLDRDGCNRMIRALRKARDAAYGADA